MLQKSVKYSQVDMANIPPIFTPWIPRWWNFRFFHVSPRNLGKWSHLTCAYFFRWVEATHSSLTGNVPFAARILFQLWISLSRCTFSVCVPVRRLMGSVRGPTHGEWTGVCSADTWIKSASCRCPQIWRHASDWGSKWQAASCCHCETQSRHHFIAACAVSSKQDGSGKGATWNDWKKKAIAHGGSSEAIVQQLVSNPPPLVEDDFKRIEEQHGWGVDPNDTHLDPPFGCQISAPLETSRIQAIISRDVRHLFCSFSPCFLWVWWVKVASPSKEEVWTKFQALAWTH